VAALAVILDTCALVLACGPSLVADELLVEQAAFTFAMARHAAVDLAQVFGSGKPAPRFQVTAGDGRLSPAEHARLREVLAAMGVVRAQSSAEEGDADGGGRRDQLDDRLADLRALYEPYLESLAEYLLMDLPPWAPAPEALDDWQTTADNVTAPSVAALVEQQHSASTGRADAQEHAS
jgi:hypothetical protein